MSFSLYYTVDYWANIYTYPDVFKDRKPSKDVHPKQNLTAGIWDSIHNSTPVQWVIVLEAALCCWTSTVSSQAVALLESVKQREKGEKDIHWEEETEGWNSESEQWEKTTRGPASWERADGENNATEDDGGSERSKKRMQKDAEGDGEMDKRKKGKGNI